MKIPTINTLAPRFCDTRGFRSNGEGSWEETAVRWDSPRKGQSEPNHEVEFSDGQKTEVAANIIAQNMYAQCDSEDNQYLLLAGIVDHKQGKSAVARSDMWIQKGSNQRMRQTTKGWHLCVDWKDGTTSWERLADLKESNPIEVAEYAVTHGIDGEAAFAWWVPFMLKQRNRIIAAVNKRYHKRTHKFGIEIPKTYEDCVRIDRENGNTLCQDAIRKEMSKVRVAFEVLPPSHNSGATRLLN